MYEDQSDDDYNSDNDANLAKYRDKYQNREESDDEVEVLGVRSESESDSDDQSDIALSDVEGQDEDDNLPDSRAWGREKKKYYGTDYVDQDYGGFQGKDAFAAEAEHEEAKVLQQQLMDQFDVGVSDITDVFKKSIEPVKKETTEESLKTDLSKLSSKQRLLNLKKESPELLVLIDDFEAQLTIAKTYLHPIIDKVRQKKLQPCRAVDFVQTHYRLILNYTTNIYMYLLLKYTNKLKNHPVTQRLYQYKQLLSKMEPVFEEVIKPQISLILEQQAKELEVLKVKKKKTLQLLAKLQPKVNNPPSKKIKLDQPEEPVVEFDGDDAKAEEKEQEVGKRGITYQIAKNKGLTPYRKKELRNPRVKHKLKFKKALIRRKGAVREPRKELTRYSGEISGIKASVTKSVKIKT